MTDHDKAASHYETQARAALYPELVECLRGLMPEGWDDGTMDHMPGIAAARALLSRLPERDKESA